MIIWSRPAVALPGAPFCAVVAVGASVETACRGRWQPSAEDAIRWTAPEVERCGGCVRELALRAERAAFRAEFRAVLEADATVVTSPAPLEEIADADTYVGPGAGGEP